MKDIVPLPLYQLQELRKRLEKCKTSEGRVIIQTMLKIDDLATAIQQLQDIVRKNKLAES